MALGKKKMLHQAAASGITPSEHFDIQAENSISGNHTIDFDISPDFVWIKFRNKDSNHYWFSSQLGSKFLSSNLNGTQSSAGYMDVNDWGSSSLTFENNLFGTNSNYVSWALKGGGSSNTFNIDGTGYSTASAAGLNGGSIIPSQASVNTVAGFSIIKFTSSGNTSHTISHGLTTTPTFILYKRYSGATSNWTGYTTVLDGSWDYIQLNRTDNSGDGGSDIWGTSTTIKNISTAGSWVAFVFHNVDKFQKFGTYTGAGSSGKTVDIGFQPRFIMIKRTDDINNSTSWGIWDSVRGGTEVLRANTNGQKTTASTTQLSFTSTGISIPTSSTSGLLNESGDNYFYWAIA